MGIQFKFIEKEKVVIFKFWHQLYKCEFHIMPQKYFFDSLPYTNYERYMLRKYAKEIKFVYPS